MTLPVDLVAFHHVIAQRGALEVLEAFGDFRFDDPKVEVPERFQVVVNLFVECRTLHGIHHIADVSRASTLFGNQAVQAKRRFGDVSIADH